MSEDDYFYKAFISYSHNDVEWVRWLHRALESYRVPKRLAAREQTLKPIFRDRDELAASADLGEKIERALQMSQYLIVVCSPAAASSRWVNEEIRTFRSLGGGSRILALVVEGKPPDCFPEALIRDADTGKKLDCVAADARREGDGRRNALLKIIAGMLSVGFDDLRQREHRKQVRRLTAIAGGAMILTAITSTLAVLAVLSQQDAERRRQQSEDLISFMVDDLRGQLQPIGRLSILESVGDKALEYFASLDERDATPEVLLRRGKALNQLGAVYLDLAEWHRAVEALRASLEQTQALYDQRPDEPQFVFELSQAHYWLGSAFMTRCRETCNPDHRDYREAARHWRQYLLLSERLRKGAPGNTNYILEVAWAHNALGALSFARADYQDSRQQYLTASKWFETLLAKDDANVVYRNETANVYMGLWQCARQIGEVVQGRRYAERALATRTIPRDNAIEQHKDARWHRYMALALADVGDIAGSTRYFQIALDKARAVVQIDSDNITWKSEVATTAADLAELLSATGRDFTDVLIEGQASLDDVLGASSGFQDARELALRYRYLNGFLDPYKIRSFNLNEELARENVSPEILIRLAELAILVADEEAEALATINERLEEATRIYGTAPLNVAHARVLLKANRVNEARAKVSALLEQGNRHPTLLTMARSVGQSFTP